MVQPVDKIKENLEQLKYGAAKMKAEFEQVCEEWNDVELALSDLNHFHEFLKFSGDGVIWLEEKRKNLLDERRELKLIYQELFPHMVAIGLLDESFRNKEIPMQKNTTYGIRSIRGFNLFKDLVDISQVQNQMFADLTSKQVIINHIFQLHKEHPEIFKRTSVDVQKDPQLLENIIIPPYVDATDYPSYANTEKHEKWALFMGNEESPEHLSERLEHQLQKTIQVGTKKGRHWKG